MQIVNFIIDNILTQAPITIALIAMLGLLLQKKPTGQVISGTFKTLYKYLIRDFGVRRLAKGCTYEEFIRDLEYQRQGKE